ncbi:MAG: autotransporter-associated beta strand repeat-containing protein [Thermoguttaceae bacterium]
MFTTRIGGSTGLEKNNAGTLTLENNNTYTGDTTILAGTLVLDTQGQISPHSLIDNDATFIIHGDHAVGDITGTGLTQIEDGELTARSIQQGELSIGSGAVLTIEPLSFNLEIGSYGVFSVPEPVVPAWVIGLSLWFAIHWRRSCKY